MNASIKIKNLPPAPAPTRPYTSTEHQVCCDGYIFKKPTSIANVANLQKAITPQSRLRSQQSRNKGVYEKWDQMAKMAQAGWNIQEIADATGYTVKYTQAAPAPASKRNRHPDRVCQEGRKAKGSP